MCTEYGSSPQALRAEATRLEQIKQPHGMTVTQPFILVMKAWNRCAFKSLSSLLHQSEAASNVADILKTWGQVYGGDMTHALAIKDFNIVFDAYAKSSSANYDSKNNDIYSTANVTNGEKTPPLPAEVVYDIYTFLSSLNDVTLSSNVISCGHSMHALSYHAVVMRYAERYSGGTDAGTNQETVNAEVAAIRAYSIWKHMLNLIEKGGSSVHKDKENHTEDGIQNDLDLLVWRAHSDIVALSSHGMLRRDDAVETAKPFNTLVSSMTNPKNVGSDTEELFFKLMQTLDGKDGTNFVVSDTDPVAGYLKQAY